MNPNLEQIRAENALEALKLRGAAHGCDKPEVSRLPALILSSGLLATTAYAVEKGGGIEKALNALAKHLADERVKRLVLDEESAKRLQRENRPINAADMRDRFCRQDSQVLIAATAEALAYLGYLKRFAPEKGDAG